MKTPVVYKAFIEDSGKSFERPRITDCMNAVLEYAFEVALGRDDYSARVPCSVFVRRGGGAWEHVGHGVAAVWDVGGAREASLWGDLYGEPVRDAVALKA